MTVETYVILSLDKFNHLDEKARSGKEPAKPSATLPSDKHTLLTEKPADENMSDEEEGCEGCMPVDDVDEFKDDESKEEPKEEKKISEGTKMLVKKKTVFQRHFERMLSELEKFNGTELAIENMKQLIKAALGQSARVLPNEQKFYSLLMQHDLFHLVKNKHKIKKYFPSWFRIG